jgi:hypothetical protein
LEYQTCKLVPEVPMNSKIKKLNNSSENVQVDCLNCFLDQTSLWSVSFKMSTVSTRLLQSDSIKLSRLHWQQTLVLRVLHWKANSPNFMLLVVNGTTGVVPFGVSKM